MAELAGKSAVIKVSGTATSFTTESTSTEDDQIYIIDAATKTVWDKDTTPTVYDGGVETEESYTVNKLTGTITFAESDSERGAVTVTGKYLPMSTAAYAHDYSYSRGVELMEVPSFADDYKTRIAGLKFASGSLSQWDLSDTYYADSLVTGNPVVIEFYGESTSEPISCWALLESVEMKAALNSPQDEIVSFISTDELLDL